jgi:hypothetical protein
MNAKTGIEENDNLLDIEAAADVLIEKIRDGVLNTQQRMKEFEEFRRMLHAHEQAEREHERRVTLEVKEKVCKVAKGIDEFRAKMEASEKGKFDLALGFRNMFNYFVTQFDARKPK